MRLGIALAFSLASLGASAQQAPAPIVYFDIAGPEVASLRAFYADVFSWTSSQGGELSLSVASPLPALIREDPAEKRVYIGVEDVAAKLEEIVAHGGAIDAPRFEVPGVVVIGLFRDPAGNPMALVEMAGGKPKIP